MWKNYNLTLNMTGKFAASLPADPEGIQNMLENRMPANPPEGYTPLKELVADILEKTGGLPPADIQEESNIGRAEFPHDANGLYYEGRCVRGHLKDCANQVKDAIKPELKALKAKVANKVYVVTDVIPLMRDCLQVQKPDNTIMRFIQVLTPQGPRSTRKLIEYVEKPVLSFTIRVLDDGVITEDILRAIFDYGTLHGMGQERSQGWGRYTYTLTAE